MGLIDAESDNAASKPPSAKMQNRKRKMGDSILLARKASKAEFVSWFYGGICGENKRRGICEANLLSFPFAFLFPLQNPQQILNPYTA